MAIRICARPCVLLTILLASLSTAVTANCVVTTPEAGKRPMRKLEVKVQATTFDAERVVLVKLMNHGKAPALGTQLTLVNAEGQPILPALYSDNCFTVPPGEPLMVTIRYSADVSDGATIHVGGWNTKPASARIPAESTAQTYLQPWQQTYTTPSPTVKSATVVAPKK
jgi:Exo-beta-D-glucosaminidase Ig-fold domain